MDCRSFLLHVSIPLMMFQQDISYEDSVETTSRSQLEADNLKEPAN